MALSTSDELLRNIKNACATFDISVPTRTASLCDVLDATSAALARSEQLRESLGSSDPSLWLCLRKLWQSLLHAQVTFWDGEDENDDGIDKTVDSRPQHLRKLCLSLARLTRNLVAGVVENQNRAYEYEPDIRRLLHYYTSWTSMKDEEAILVARMLAQTLSNVITANEHLLQSLWQAYMNLAEDQVVLIRLLVSTDSKSTVPALMVIHNCIQSDEARCKLLVRTPVGARLCISLLDKMGSTYEAEEGTDEATVFDIGYAIFSRLLEFGLIPELLRELSVQDEIITPHQTVIFKLLDSYLQVTPFASNDAENLKTINGLCHLLGEYFFSLSLYAQRAIRRALGSETYPQDTTAPPVELDVILPKVCEALVLVSQCMITIILNAENATSTRYESLGSTVPSTQLKSFFVELNSEQHTLEQSLVEVLRLLDRFLPRINFGKPVFDPRSSPVGSNEQPTVSTARSATPTAAATRPISDTGEGFAYLKRDLVRLLGILCHETKAVQDRTRQCGGIEVVMNLCVVDERNPYLREHAIFTLRNLLEGNPENQALVNDIQPTSQWDEDGVLRERPGVTVRK